MRGTPLDDIYPGDQIAVVTTDETVIGDFERLDVYHSQRVLCLGRVQDGRLELREIPLAEVQAVRRLQRKRERDWRGNEQGNRILIRVMGGDAKVVR